MTATRNFYNFLKVIAIIYSLSLSGITLVIGYDAAQLTFPPIYIPLSQFRTTKPDGSIEMMFFMGYGGRVYHFIIPTLIVVHDGFYGNHMNFTVPRPFGLNLPIPIPMMLSPGSLMWFNITIPNFTNPMFQFIVLPQAWIGGMKIMEFQINTFTFPTIPIVNQTITP